MLRTKQGLKYFAMGDGPEAVVCHPSLGLGRFLFYRLVPPLSRRYRVVTYDPRGVGENAAFAPELDAWVNDVGDLMEELDRPVHLMGVSLGTWVMSRAAVRWPDRVRRLVLMGTTPGFPNGAAQVEARREELETLSMGDFAKQYASATLTASADPEVREQLVLDLSAMNPEKYLESMAAIYTAENSAVFQAISSETLIVVGSEDTRTVPRMADQAAELIAGSVVRVVPNAGHLALLDQPSRMEELILGFLASGIIDD